MTFTQFCSKFYNDGKCGCLHACRSKSAIAMFFLKKALKEVNLDILPDEDSMKKWFGKHPSNPKVSMWKHVTDDYEINEKKLQGALENSLTEDRDLLLNVMDKFSFPLTDEEKIDPNSAARSRFIGALVEQFYKIAKGSGSAPDVVSTRKAWELSQDPKKELCDYYKPYWNSISNRLSRVKTVLRDESLLFQEIYIKPGLSDSFFLEDISPFPDSTPIITDPDLTSIREYSIHTVIQATGGMGKSMLMRYLMFNGIEEFQSSGKIVVFAWLMDYDHSNYEISDFLFDEIRSYYENYDREAFNRELSTDSFVILLDGLDEIKSKYRSQFLSRLHKFSSIHCDMQIIMTSRPFESDLDLGNFSELTICPLSLEKAADVVRKLPAEDNTVQEEFISALNRDLYEDYHVFAKCPLLLTFMFLTFREKGRIPKLKARFYEEVYTVLAYRHDRFKTNFERALDSGLTPERFREIFAVLCANSFLAEVRSFYHVDLYYSFKEIIKELPTEEERNLNPDMLIMDALTGVCMLYREGERYYFVHNSFQEYFTAVCLERQDKEDLRLCLEELYINGKARDGDMSLPFMYELMRDRITELLLYPYLKSLFDECEQLAKAKEVDLFCAYLLHVDASITYTRGYKKDFMGFCDRVPPVHTYILDFSGEPVPLDESSLPYYKDFVEHYCYSFLDEYGCSHDIEFEEGQEGFAPPDETKIVDDSELDRYVFDLNAPLSKVLTEKEKYEDMYNYVMSEDCFFRNEFVIIKNFYHSLQQEMSRINSKTKLRVKLV